MQVPVGQVFKSPNQTTYLGDLVQILGEELGLTDIPQYEAAKAIQAVAAADTSDGLFGTHLNVFAHSQGTQVFLGATQFLDAATRSMIAYHGYGGEAQLGSNLGLGYVLNDPGFTGVASRNDPVAGIAATNFFKDFFNGFMQFPRPDGLIFGIGNLFSTHKFITNYLPKIGPGDLR